MLTSKGLKIKTELDKLDDNRFSFIKDNMEALTAYEIPFEGSSRWSGYYKQDIMQQKEIFANLIEIQLNADEKIQALAKKHMPKLYKEVAKFLKRM